MARVGGPRTAASQEWMQKMKEAGLAKHTPKDILDDPLIHGDIPPALLSGPQDVKDEDVIANPSYDVSKGYFSKAYSTWGLNIRNEPYRRTKRPHDLYKLKARVERQQLLDARERADDLLARPLRDGEMREDVPVVAPVFGMSYGEVDKAPDKADAGSAGGSSGRPPPPAGPPPGRPTTDLHPPASPIALRGSRAPASGSLGRAKSESALPAVTVAAPPDEYKGVQRPMRELQARPAIGFYPSGEAERRKNIRKRALVGHAMGAADGVAKGTRKAAPMEKDEDALRRRVLSSYATGVLSCPMMGYTEIPAGMKSTLYMQVGCIKELYLADNQIEEFPSNFCQLVRTIHTLVLKRNKLTTMPVDFGNMTRLTRLDLSDNSLSTLPKSVTDMTNLTDLRLSNNTISKLPAMPFPRLTFLDVSFNGLEQLPDGFFDCGELRTLEASHNSLMALTIFNPVVAEPDANLKLDLSEWEEVVDPYTGATTYMNKRTKKASRANPARLLAAAKRAYFDAWEFTTDTWSKPSQKPASASDPSLAWERVFDKDSKSEYWYNNITGESQWDRPDEVPPSSEESSSFDEESSSEEEDDGAKSKAKSTLSKEDKRALAVHRVKREMDKEEREKEAAAKAAEEKAAEEAGPPPPLNQVSENGTKDAEALSQLKGSTKSALSGLLAGPEKGTAGSQAAIPAASKAAGGDAKAEQSDSPKPKSSSAAANWIDQKGPPRNAILTPRDGDDDKKSKASRRKKKGKKEKKKNAADTAMKAAKGRQSNMRLLCLMHQGRGEWETVQDQHTGTIMYRYCITKELYPDPPTESDRFGDLTALTRLRLSHNKLAILPKSFGRLHRLEELLLDYNLLHPESFPNSFGRLGIQHLDLAHNVVRHVPGPISNLQYLKHLDMRNNKLSRFEKKFLKLSNLTTLYLPGNRIHELPVAFQVMTNLVTLDLADNPLLPQWKTALVKGLDHAMFLCRQIDNERKYKGKPPEMQYTQTGIAGEATLTKAEADVWIREQLRLSQRTGILKLQFKMMRMLPADLFMLKNLRELKIVGNILPLIPVAMKGFTSLRVMMMRSNQIEVLPEDLFENMTSLRDLHLEENRLTRLPDTFTRLTTLISLRLSANQIRKLPDELGDVMPSLIDLWVDNNKLRHLPSSLGSLTTLELLVATNNKIEDLPISLRNMTKLKNARLQGNRITEFPKHVLHMTTLESINLASNWVQKIPRQFLFSNLAMSIRRIHLQNNYLVEVPAGLHWMSSLTDLRLDNNPMLRSPPQSVTIGGVSDIFAFSAIRSRNVRQLLERSVVSQFMVNVTRFHPRAKCVLTGGLGLLQQEDLDEFDDIVDKVVNTHCHETQPDTIERLITDFAGRRVRYFKSLHEAVYKKFKRGLELIEQENWVDKHHFSTRVMRPVGPDKRFARCYAVSFQAMFGSEVLEGKSGVGLSNCVSALLEKRLQEGDRSCEGPRLTPMLVCTALYSQQYLFGRAVNVADWVDFSPDSPDLLCPDIVPIDEERKPYYVYEDWQRNLTEEEAEKEKEVEDGRKRKERRRMTEAEKALAEEKAEFHDFVLPSRLKFSAKPKLPKFSPYIPKPKLAFVHVYHDWTSVDLENAEREKLKFQTIHGPIEDDAKWALRTIEGKEELENEMKTKRQEVSEDIESSIRNRGRLEEALVKAENLAVQNLSIRQSLFKGLGPVPFPEPDEKKVKEAEKTLSERALLEAAKQQKGGSHGPRKWKQKQQAHDSGGGDDDPDRRAHLDKVWKVGMSVTRHKVDLALAKYGLTRADTDGIDHEIMQTVKEVLTTQRDYIRAKKRTVELSDSPANKLFGPAYKEYTKKTMTQRRIDAARRQFVAAVRVRAMRHPKLHRWWDGPDGEYYHNFQKFVVQRRNSRGKLDLVPPLDPKGVEEESEVKDEDGDKDSDESSGSGESDGSGSGSGSDGEEGDSEFDSDDEDYDSEDEESEEESEEEGDDA